MIFNRFQFHKYYVKECLFKVLINLDRFKKKLLLVIEGHIELFLITLFDEVHRNWNVYSIPCNADLIFNQIALYEMLTSKI